MKVLKTFFVLAVIVITLCTVLNEIIFLFLIYFDSFSAKHKWLFPSNQVLI